MSAYIEVVTLVRDEATLIDALCCMENARGRMFTRDQIEVHPKGAKLYGYQGDVRAETAQIIIRRENVGGASNDIGFERGADGTFCMHVSEYDRGHYNQKWQQKLVRTYSELYIGQKAEKHGYTVKKTKNGENIQLSLVKWG